MSTFEAIQLMIAFATLVLLIIDSKDQKKQPSNALAGFRWLKPYYCHRLFNGSALGLCSRIAPLSS
ncbi:putative holin-like toxin [Enterococcus durans]|uniref:putative holin-like toxin n=1 Tax=Enterococcus durans TaxID=53345 RepID=UPI00115E870E|nr:putative holin-like toxin [Enterococcus durans]